MANINMGVIEALLKKKNDIHAISGKPIGVLLEDFAPIKETMKVEIPQEMLPGVLQDNNNPTEPTIPFRVDSCGYLGEFLHAGKLKAIVNSTIATIRSMNP